MYYIPGHLWRVARDFDQPSSIIESVITNQPHASERGRHLLVAPCEPPDGIQLLYADDRGRHNSVALEDATAIDFGRVAGYAGRDTTRRGPDVAEEDIWTVAQLQELFDEWVIAFWQNRPYEGLSHTWGEGRDLSPNEMFAACVGISGYVPLPLNGDDCIELLPAVFLTVNDYGLTVDNRTYDYKALNPYRRLDSGLPGGNRKQWEGPLRSLRHHRHLAARPPS